MTEDEADRLSERFRPSWEEDVPTVPRDQPVPEPPSTPQATPPASSPAVVSSPIVTITKAPVIAVTDAKAVAPAPAAPASAPASSATQTPLVVPAARRPTLLGTAPAPASSDPAAASAPAASAPLASPAVESPSVAVPPSVAVAPIVTPRSAEPDAELVIDVEVSPASEDHSAPAVEVDAPPDSKPSGIGQKYVPKEEGAPAVMLGPEVAAAESGQSARLEAEHRARRAPTMVRMQAFDLPPPVAQPAQPELEFPTPRRSRAGIIIAAGAALLIGVAVLALTVASSAPDKSHPQPDATAALAVTPDTKAPVPPAVPPTTAATAPDKAEPRASATAAPLVTPKLASPAQKPVTNRSLPQAKAVAFPKAPAPKSASGGTKPGGKSMIVRENPF